MAKDNIEQKQHLIDLMNMEKQLEETDLNMCKCGINQVTDYYHSFPYACDINDDCSESCNCCDECTHECAMDI
jgi:hypothetical protein